MISFEPPWLAVTDFIATVTIYTFLVGVLVKLITFTVHF